MNHWVRSLHTDREVRRLDERALSWGQEKTLSTGTQTIGAATQTFLQASRVSGQWVARDLDFVVAGKSGLYLFENLTHHK